VKRKVVLLSTLTLVLAFASVYVVLAWTPKAVADDPLVRMPGTQPGQVALEAPNRCLNCHGGYNSEVEPGYNWKGSMMAQSARDFLYFACLTVAGQDSIWAVGTPNAVDICERCHFPKGWLEGRSDPANASLMTGADYDGVQCDFCHTLYDPFFEGTHNLAREGDLNNDGTVSAAEWKAYWDETNVSSTPSQPAADATYAEDMAQALAIVKFNGTSFYDENKVPPANYTENGGGQYFVSSGSQKRASFADAAARHQMFYSRYHKSKYFCNTCHDVSNPVLANLGQDGSAPLTTETQSAYSYFHVERTFSEFMLSAYGVQGGAATNPEFQAQGATDITHAAKCQDCHMRDVVGMGANKNGAPVRPTQSVEHPNSGQPLHDMTGGNAWVSYVLASAVPGSPNYDATNDALLHQGPAALTLDLTQGEGIDPAALLAGVDRSKQQLLLAATIKDLSYDPATGALSFQIQNNTAHKLISGFPEGRRMFVNIKAHDAAGGLIYEVNPYDIAAGTLKGLDYPHLGNGLPSPAALADNEAYVDELVYEMKPSSTDLTGEAKTFHFALATGRYKDNRIPAKGFDIGGAAARLSVPVYGGTENPGYFSSDEYAGGYDAVALSIPAGADYVEVNLYYQTTSREYIEFLRDEIKGTGNLTLPDPVPGTPDVNEAYLIQTDPFFSQLAAWGNTIWQLWTHNMNVPGAAPFLMTSGSQGTPPQPPCSVPAPTLASATPGHTQVSLEWSAVADATGYNVYYDQAGKAQLVADAGSTTTYLDTGLTDGVEYCYKVTAYNATCESGYSNILCATPQNQGQTTDPAGVDQMVTGIWTGKGQNKQFTAQILFNAGDSVTIRALVLDGVTGLPISNATVAITIGGPETVTLNSNPSDADGWAEATWGTQAPNRKGQGGTATDGYTATVTNVTASGYHWDSVTTSTTFTIQ
jgi:hypothetical protein